MSRLYTPLVACWMLVLLSCSGPRPLNPRAIAQENACIQSLQIQDFEGAKVRCELCLEYDDSVAACMNGLGLVSYARGDIDKAVSYFKKAIKQSKNFAQARNNLGAVYFHKNNFTGGIPYFKAALDIDPGYEDARYNLGLSYLRLGQYLAAHNNKKEASENYKLAKKQYLKLISVNPAYANGYRDLGLIMTYEASMEKVEADRVADLKSATSYFENCLQVDPNSETCHESYGQLLIFEKQEDAAMHHFALCLASNKKNAACISGMDAAYQGSQLKSEALKSYVTLLKEKPNDPKGHYGYCSVLFDHGLNDLAVAECQRAIQLDPKTCPAYYLLGMYYKQVLNSTEALSNCKSFALCPGSDQNLEQTKQCNRVITALSGS